MRASLILVVFVGAIVATVLSSAGPAIRPALAAAQPLIGYERWTNPGAKSGVDFGLTEKQVFEKYAKQMLIGMPVPDGQVTDKRLIDIEIRPDDGPLANYVYDVVSVKNEGEFELESWFVPGLTEAELHLLPQLAPQGIVAVDVERYPKGNEWRYSVILQRNADKVYFEILTDAPWADVQSSYERQGLRLLDLDYAVKGPLYTSSCQSGRACNLASFDAILVGNSGSFHIDTKFWFNLTPAQIADKQAQGYQMIDREDGGLSVATVWVKPGLPFEIHPDAWDDPNFSVDHVIWHHNHHGRVVDLEYKATSFSIYSIVNFSSSAAPASPELATPRQGDTDDGRGHAKHRDGKAKDKKAGKHGKGKSSKGKSGNQGKNKHGKGKHRR